MEHNVRHQFWKQLALRTMSRLFISIEALVMKRTVIWFVRLVCMISIAYILWILAASILHFGPIDK